MIFFKKSKTLLQFIWATRTDPFSNMNFCFKDIHIFAEQFAFIIRVKGLHHSHYDLRMDTRLPPMILPRM